MRLECGHMVEVWMASSIVYAVHLLKHFCESGDSNMLFIKSLQSTSAIGNHLIQLIELVGGVA